jgi:phage terminase large subunit GpA-like protein
MDDVKSIPEVPTGVLVLTAGIDVGEKMVAYEVVGWGKGRESWGIEFSWIDGDPRQADVWAALDQTVFKRVFTCSDGKKMRVRRMAVDSGYAADFVYAYTKPRQPRCIATKGVGGLGKPFILGPGTITKASRVRLQLLGVDAGKEEITNRFNNVTKPGPGFCHFPQTENGEPMRGYDETFFAGLKAEHRVIRHKLGFRTYVWTKLPSQRNEPFDCRILALAALVMPSSGIKLDTMSRDVFEKEPAKVGQASSMFGPRRMVGAAALGDIGPPIMKWVTPYGEKPKSGFGALPGSGVSF